MAKEKEFKLLTVKKESPELYEKVMNGEMSLHEAYNETRRKQLNLSEFRGTNTRKKEFSVDFKRLIELHDPTVEELIAEIKKAFPLTWKTFIIEPKKQ
jgi:hypothetical protein